MDAQRPDGSDGSPEDRLRELTGLEDDVLLRELIAAGLDAEAAPLLPIFPLLRVGWANGKLEQAERDRILDFFPAPERERRPVAAARLERWLEERPPEQTFEAVERALRQLLAAAPPQHASLFAEQLRELCLGVARAAGGWFGLGRISRAEREALEHVQALLARP